MERTLGLLGQYLYEDEWSTYPVRFVKYVYPSTEEKERMWNILSDCTGLSREELQEKIKEGTDQEEGYMTFPVWEFSPGAFGYLNLPAFQEMMERVCRILGPGSDLKKILMNRDILFLATYEEAMEAYHDFLYKDRITGGYARLFGDYMGIAPWNPTCISGSDQRNAGQESPNGGVDLYQNGPLR